MIGRKRESSSEPIAQEEAERTLYGFRVVHVFDVEQTVGEDLPRWASMSGDTGSIWDAWKS